MQSGGARRAREPGAEEGWAQVEPGFTWSDLVLADSERALLQTASASLEAGAPVRLLFTGGPGTGKTMACQILAAAVEAPAFSLEASRKATLEAETVEEVLRAAGRVGAVVVFDHADLLLRGRTEPRQAGAGLSATALLARVRDHAGGVVFTATATRGIKDELLAEFDSVVEFPFPDGEARTEIWRRLLPGDSRLTGEDLDHLAASFPLTGAAIRACASVAILAAEAEAIPLSLVHVTHALELEYRDRLAGEATRAALAELRRRSGIEDRAEVRPLPTPLPGPAERRLRPALRLPRRGRADEPRDDTARSRLARLRAAAVILPWRWVALTLLATIVAAALGFLAGKATSSHTAPKPAAKRASLGLGTLTVPAAWHRHAPPLRPALGLSSELALSPGRSADRTLLIGTASTSAPTFLPSALLAALPAVPAPHIVRVGALQFYRYQLLSAPGQTRAETLYVLPTTGGTVVGDCVSAGLDSAFDASCQDVLATLSLSSASALSLIPSASYTSQLDHVMFPLNLARLNDAAQLSRARTPSAIARAARALAAAHATAAAGLRGVNAGIATAANAALVTAFTQTAAAYRALARTALHGNRRGYRRAQASLARADAAVATAYAELRTLGYRVG